MSTATVPAEITRFAEQVRAELADLSVEDLDDLTEGLEADLAESLEEDPARELPDPVAYAAELRTAAGLPFRPEPGRGVRGAVRGMTTGLRSTGHQVAESLRGHPVTAGLLGFLEAIRPTWWVLRAWVAYWLVAAFFGSEAGFAPRDLWWLVLLVFIVVSVQLGRGRWRAKGVPTFVVLGNIAAAIVVIPVLVTAGSWGESSDVHLSSVEEASPGTTLNGRPVTNIYAYGADGQPVRDVQLFDQDGVPLTLSPESVYYGCPDASCDELHPEPIRLETGEQARNVYPLTLVPMGYDEFGELSPVSPTEARTPQAPFVKVPSLDRAEKVE